MVPGQGLGGILTFELPRELRRSKVSQPFTIYISVGSDTHTLSGFAGPIGTSPPLPTHAQTQPNLSVPQTSSMVANETKVAVQQGRVAEACAINSLVCGQRPVSKTIETNAQFCARQGWQSGSLQHRQCVANLDIAASTVAPAVPAAEAPAELTTPVATIRNWSAAGNGTPVE